MSQSGTPSGPPLPPNPSDSSPDPDPAPRRNGRRGWLWGAAIGTAVVVLVPAGAVAWKALDGGGSQPHDVLPADALAYLHVDLDPSASQKVAAFRFLDRFPVFDERTDELDEDTDLREWVVDQFASNSGCPLDYASDVEPWIGDRAGLAVVPGDNGEEPDVALALRTDDEDAATETLTTIADCTDEEIGVAYLDGYAILAETTDAAQRYVAAAEQSPLTDNEEFATAMDLLGEQGVVSGWLSGSGIFDLTESELATPPSLAGTSPVSAGLSELPDLPDPDQARELVEQTNVAFTFRFNHDSAELASVVTSDSFTALDGGVNADVPEQTTLMLGIADAGQSLRDQWNELEEAADDASGWIADLEARTGLTFPDDLSTILGDNLVVALDASGLDVSSLRDGNLSSLDLGLKVATDPEAFREVWERLSTLARTADVPLGSLPIEITDDGYVLAANPGYGDALVQGGTLGASDVYTAAVDNSDEADFVFFLDMDAVEQQLASIVGDELPEPAWESIRELRAVGISGQVLDGHIAITARVTAD